MGTAKSLILEEESGILRSTQEKAIIEGKKPTVAAGTEAEDNTSVMKEAVVKPSADIEPLI